MLDRTMTRDRPTETSDEKAAILAVIEAETGLSRQGLRRLVRILGTR